MEKPDIVINTRRVYINMVKMKELLRQSLKTNAEFQQTEQIMYMFQNASNDNHE
jgi:hypothetical protein